MQTYKDRQETVLAWSWGWEMELTEKRQQGPFLMMAMF